MQPTIGFVILSRSEPGQLLRLTRTLTVLYGDPPIAVHHDFGQCPFDPREDFTPAVSFVQPIATAWAKWSIVEAAMRALSLLYERADPDWFFLLSGADYPLQKAEVVRAALASGRADAYLDCHHLYGGQGKAMLVGDPSPRLGHFLSPGSRRLKLNHYINAEVWLPFIRRRPTGGFRLGRYTARLPFRASSLPFGPDYGCFYGDQWFAGNRKVADILLNPSSHDLALQKHLRFRSIVLKNSGRLPLGATLESPSPAVESIVRGRAQS